MNRSMVVIALTASLSVSTFAIAAPQTHDHRGAAAGSTVEQFRGADLAELLKAGDVSVGAVQAAIRKGDSKLATDSVSQFVLVADSIAAYFDVDPPRPAKEATRAHKALERQTRQLAEAAQAAPPDLQPAIEAAIDAGGRTYDVVEASTQATAPAPAAHHRRRSGACGHH